MLSAPPGQIGIRVGENWNWKPIHSRSGQVRSGQVSFITRPKSKDHEGQAKKTFESKQNEGVQIMGQMSNELESDGAMVMNLESFGVDGVTVLQYGQCSLGWRSW
jgi:hypothetical protein